MARAFAGRIVFARLNGDDSENEETQGLAAALRVGAFPSFYAFEHGSHIPTHKVEGASPAKLDELAQKLLNEPSPAPSGEAAAGAAGGAGGEAAGAEAGGFPSKVGRYVDITDVIDKKRTACLNEVTRGGYHANLWTEGEAATLQSDCDPQLLLYLPFKHDTKQKLGAIVIKAPDAENRPTMMKLFVDRPTMGFDDVDAYEPTAEFKLSGDDLAEGKPIMLPFVKFQNVTSLTIFFDQPDDEEAEKSIISHLRLYGVSSSTSALLLEKGAGKEA